MDYIRARKLILLIFSCQRIFKPCHAYLHVTLQIRTVFVLLIAHENYKQKNGEMSA